MKRRRPAKPTPRRLRRPVRNPLPKKFEKLFADLSAAFARASAPEIDNEIARWLQRLVLALNLDRAAVAQVDPLFHRVFVSHQWGRAGVPRIPEHEDFRQLAPGYVRKLLAGESVIYSNLQELGRELPDDLMAARAFILGSHVGIPLRIGGAVVGAVGFATRKQNRSWDADVIARLQLVAEVLGNALERKRNAVERIKLREQLRHVSRAATLSELAASIAHELNQPIAAILSNAEAIQNLLGADSPDLAEVRTAIGEIIQDDVRAGETIQRLRALFRNHQLDKVPLDLGKVVREIGEIAQADAFARNVSFVLDSVTPLPPLLADRVQLQQAIMNLVLNAFDAVGAVAKGAREVTVTIRKRPHWIVIQVSDSGPGIDPAVLPQIFDPFFTTKPSGMGMGLALSRSIIDAHGGRIAVSPDSSSGATFVVELPVRPDISSRSVRNAAVQ